MRGNFLCTSVLLLSLVLVGCGQGIKDPLNWKIEDLSAVTEEGKEMGLDDLKGKVRIADFIFTNCATVCPPMTANMTKLQGLLKEKGLEVEIVSFSVDPAVDTPERLKEYALKFNADLSNWHLLTGYSQDFIEDYALKNFKTIVQKPDTDTQVIHGTSFYLIDQEGKVVKDYNGITVPFDDIIKDASILISKGSTYEKKEK
ncbi:SCO family protein [Bacillus sp. FJAT-49705]|uniref:SCO family protein n=1 Tax=Cytobacillus citreus TaxID=2833586 RepID=A0ABS5NRF4_9BACI|nr:SCO family protein [Cytobacillus citreus]MBS4190404.1 SCO family protein [Cytobacillus citreus]